MAGFASWGSPSRYYGGMYWNQPGDQQENPWSKYLGGLGNEEDERALGLSGPDDEKTQNTAWNRYLSMMSQEMSPNAVNALNQNRWRVNAAFEQARATDPGARFATVLGGFNPTSTVQSWSPNTAFRPVNFKRIKFGLQ